MKKITKYDLEAIRSKAIDSYTVEPRNDLDDQQFMTMCWLKACSAYLGTGALEFPTPRPIVEPAEE